MGDTFQICLLVNLFRRVSQLRHDVLPKEHKQGIFGHLVALEHEVEKAGRDGSPYTSCGPVR